MEEMDVVKVNDDDDDDFVNLTTYIVNMMMTHVLIWLCMALI